MVKKEKTQEEEKVDYKKVIATMKKELEDTKKEVIKDVSTKIDNQIELAVSKRMKEEEKRIVRGKNSKIITRDIIIIILLAIIGYFGYALYKVDYFHIGKKIESNNNTVKNNVVDNKANDNKEQDDKKNEEEVKPDYIKEYGYLIDNLYIEDEEIFSLYNKNTTSKNISNSLIQKIAYQNLKDKTIEDNMISFTSSDLLESAKKIFGSKVTIEDDTFTYNNTRFMYFKKEYVGYLEETKEENKLLYEIKSADMEDDELVFEVIIAKLSNNSLLDNNDKVVVKKYNNEELKKYENKLPSYEIKFIKENNNYIFDSLNIKE